MMPKSAQDRIVDFDDPPVVETVLGLRFAPLPGWSIPHFGLFWEEIRKDYPKFEVHPPVGTASQIELRVEADEHENKRPVLELSNTFPVRCWFYDPSETTLIQIQSDCFIHNWRKITGTEPYSHYDVIRPLFERAWQRFCNFLEREKIPSPKVWQCEVSYINHLERGVGWSSFADLSEIVPGWSGKGSTHFLPSPEAVHINAIYPLANKAGTLQVVLQPAVRQKDGKEIIQLSLTAKGKPLSSTLPEILHWLDLGHEWVVQGFKDFTSQRMHQIWRVKV
jgi:uncharacterized protein (TIGR04255 family)